MKIPIFIIVHDRVKVLKKTVQSLECLISTPIEIIFHDVASTFPACLEYLQEMRERKYSVYKSKKNHHHTVVQTVDKYLTIHPECEYYVITDPDIELDNVNSDILEFYIFLSKKYKDKLVVGPMLRIDDIPNYYPKKKLVIVKHTAQFWSKKPQKIVWNKQEYNIQLSLIDTTFQLVHRDNKSRFPRAGIRCYAPYSARHLDWYIDPDNMSVDQEYYSEHALKIAHWGKMSTKSVMMSK
jgi:hypothetical protein